MYKILIIEDEVPARKKLKRFIDKLDIEYIILDEIDTITGVETYFRKKNEIDIIFSDIELKDGNIFELYSHIELNSPIIFTTAYNEFLLNAFETNGIEYLLKPFSFDRFSKAWNKFLKLNKFNDNENVLEKLNSLLNPVHASEYKDQFAIKSGSKTYFLKTETVICFQAENGVVFAIDSNNKSHIMPKPTLKDIEPYLDPNQFFRINRSEIINKAFIDSLERYNKNILSISLNNGKKELRTSQNNTAEFNSWMGI